VCADFQVQIILNIAAEADKLVAYQHQALTESDTLKAVNVV
jgi:hypothetical protein